MVHVNERANECMEDLTEKQGAGFEFQDKMRN